MTSAPASIDQSRQLRLDWLIRSERLRCLGLSSIIWLRSSAWTWFTNPSNNWPDFATRIHRAPFGSSLPVAIVQFLGGSGDSAPGVFILVSGVGLTLSVLNSESQKIDLDFFKRRVLRIFPLYIAMHFVILAGSLAVPGSTLSFASRKTFFSLLGPRFTDSLFFYISPAWWFIWLILQLYCVFPFLFKLLQRTGLKRFLAITLTITFAARLLGILYSQQLYYWMTGIFFVTRLAEFCAGMAIAAYL
jgi:peptidoglycan/LPS O-acetylase OafA/YrhL